MLTLCSVPRSKTRRAEKLVPKQSSVKNGDVLRPRKNIPSLPPAFDMHLIVFRVYLINVPVHTCTVYSNVNDIETKRQIFRYRSLLPERKLNVLIWSPYYQIKSKTFWFGPKFYSKQIFFFVLAQKLWDDANQFDLVLEIVLGKVQRFYSVQILKQKVLIWFAYYRNESKTFWFDKKKVFSQADRFRFGSKNKAVWFGLEIVLGKLECLYLIQKLKDQSKTLWFGPLVIRTKAKRFDLVHIMSFFLCWKVEILIVVDLQYNVVWESRKGASISMYIFMYLGQ